MKLFKLLETSIKFFLQFIISVPCGPKNRYTLFWNLNMVKREKSINEIDVKCSFFDL